MQKKFSLPTWLVPLGIFVLVLALVAGAVFGIRAFTRRNNIDIGQTISISTDAQVKPFGNQFLYLANMTIYCVSPQGDTQWTIPLERDDAPYDVMGDYLCVADTDALKTYKRAKDGTMELYYTKSLQGLLMDDVVCGKKHAALLTDTRDTLYVLDDAGSQIDTITLSGQTIVNLGFFSSQDLLWVISIDTQGGAPTTNVHIYEPARATIAMQRFSDELVSTLVIDSQRALALTMGTQYITGIDVSLSGQNVKADATSIYGYQYVCDNGAADVSIVLAPAAQLLRQSVSDLYLYRGGKLSAISLPTQCQAFAITEKFLYAANTSTVYRMDHTGEVLEQIDMAGLYDRVQAVGKNHLLFFNGPSAAIVTIK